jgi:hypothetical protein
MSFLDTETLWSSVGRTFVAIGLFLLTVLCSNLLKKRLSQLHSLPYPPGPKPKLFVGNIQDMPATKAWVTYANWVKEYGMLICC